MNNRKLLKEDFRENGIGPLYRDLYEGKITSKEFAEKIDMIDNRPVMKFGRFVNHFLESVLPVFFKP